MTIQLYGISPVEAKSVSKLKKRAEITSMKYDNVKYNKEGEDEEEFRPSSFISSRTNRYDFSQQSGSVADDEDIQNQLDRLKVTINGHYHILKDELARKLRIIGATIIAGSGLQGLGYGGENETNDEVSMVTEAPKKKKRKVKLNYDYGEEDDNFQIKSRSLKDDLTRMTKSFKPLVPFKGERDTIYNKFIKIKVQMAKAVQLEVPSGYKFKHNLPQNDSLDVDDDDEQGISIEEAQQALTKNLVPYMNNLELQLKYRLYLHSIINRANFELDTTLKNQYIHFVKAIVTSGGTSTFEEKSLIVNKFVKSGTITEKAKTDTKRIIRKIEVTPIVLKRLGIS